mmetsp:Transcript_49634/g.155390  ORF Transcript_49634/g.155390 Transcript_49634/m.155390 type:complete len:152 (+) Transcript_49634:589-1044(+)
MIFSIRFCINTSNAALASSSVLTTVTNRLEGSACVLDALGLASSEERKGEGFGTSWNMFAFSLENFFGVHGFPPFTASMRTKSRCPSCLLDEHACSTGHEHRNMGETLAMDAAVCFQGFIAHLILTCHTTWRASCREGRGAGLQFYMSSDG